MLDDKNSWHRNDIPKNDEPTRFLTKEEMEQLEQGIFENANSDKAEKKVSNIKIEDLPKQEKIFSVKSKKPIKAKIKKYIKRLLLTVVFVAAGIAGFYLSFSWSLHNQSEQNAKEYDVKQLELRQQKLDEQEKDLEMQIAQLKQEKDELSKKHEEVSKDKSFLVELIDKFTGKDAEDRATADDLQNKITKLEQNLDDMNLQMDKLKDVKNQVDDLKVTAQKELDEHRDVIDTVKFQIKEMADDFLQK